MFNGEHSHELPPLPDHLELYQDPSLSYVDSFWHPGGNHEEYTMMSAQPQSSSYGEYSPQLQHGRRTDINPAALYVGFAGQSSHQTSLFPPFPTNESGFNVHYGSLSREQHHHSRESQGRHQYPGHADQSSYHQAGQNNVHTGNVYPQHDSSDVQDLSLQMSTSAVMANSSTSGRSPQVTPDPYEYQYVADPSFLHDNDHDSVYRYLTVDQRAVVVEHVHRIRPYVIRHIRNCLAHFLPPSIARSLLTNNELEIEAAVEKMWPFHERKQYPSNPWMEGLNNHQRIEVVRLMAEATLQSADLLRDHFLRQNVSLETALDILYAPNPHVLVLIARERGLIMPEEKKKSRKQAWQIGLSTVQKRALRQRFFNAGVTDDDKFYLLVRKPKVWPGYGLVMLKAGDQYFDAILEALKGRDPLPTPQ
ncbi:hypothetical protein CBS101457_000123 [Exobasidium rhododendri]|nr:hypothetical protein CBS101457_000123 [Exobasidium rhododendri]